MFTWKRFLLLGSLSLTLLTGLLFTASTSGSHAVFASGCNSVAKGSWSNNCQTSEGNISTFVVAIQTVITYSGTGCTTNGIDGSFGSNTLAGVECFQHAKGISVDGIVGPITWGKLQNTLICSRLNNFTVGCHLPKNSAVLFEEELNNSDIWVVLFKGSFCEMVDSRLC